MFSLMVILTPVLACLIRAIRFGVSGQFFLFIIYSGIIILNIFVNLSQFNFGALWEYWSDQSNWRRTGVPLEERKDDPTSTVAKESWVLLLLLISVIFAFHPKGLRVLERSYSSTTSK